MLQIEVVDYSKIGEILIRAINEANQFFDAMKLQHQFKSNISDLPESTYDVYMAKKDNGKPKDDYPTFDYKMSVKSAKVKKNRFSVAYNEDALSIISKK